MVVVVHDLIHRVLDGRRVDGIDAREELRARDAAAVRQELAPDFLGRGTRARLGVQQQQRLVLISRLWP